MDIQFTGYFEISSVVQRTNNNSVVEGSKKYKGSINRMFYGMNK